MKIINRLLAFALLTMQFLTYGWWSLSWRLGKFGGHFEGLKRPQTEPQEWILCCCVNFYHSKINNSAYLIVRSFYKLTYSCTVPMSPVCFTVIKSAAGSGIASTGIMSCVYQLLNQLAAHQNVASNTAISRLVKSCWHKMPSFYWFRPISFSHCGLAIFVYWLRIDSVSQSCLEFFFWWWQFYLKHTIMVYYGVKWRDGNNVLCTTLLFLIAWSFLMAQRMLPSADRIPRIVDSGLYMPDKGIVALHVNSVFFLVFCAGKYTELDDLVSLAQVLQAVVNSSLTVSYESIKSE